MFEGATNKFSYYFPGTVLGLLAYVAMVAPNAAVAPPVAPGMRWVEVSGPARVAPGKAFVVSARARNIGASAWEPVGEGRAEVAAMVVDGTGNPWTGQPRPGRFAYAVPPGGAGTARVHITAPDIPGSYTVLLGVTHWESGRATPDPALPARLEFQVAAPAR